MLDRINTTIHLHIINIKLKLKSIKSIYLLIYYWVINYSDVFRRAFEFIRYISLPCMIIQIYCVIDLILYTATQSQSLNGEDLMAEINLLNIGYASRLK
jgi:hypothetical protein